MKHLINKLKKTGSRALLLPVILCCLLATKGSAQVACGLVDLASASITSDLPVIAKKQTATIFVTLRNDGPVCFIPVGEATAQVTLSSVFFDLAVPFNFVSNCGQWTFLGNFPTPGSHNLFFRNNAGPIPVGGPFCGFRFNIGGKAVTPVPSTISLTSSISGSATNSDGDPSDQSASTKLYVDTKPSPSPTITITDFSVKANECNAVLTWKTSTSSNVDSFEIEYGFNEKEFTRAGVLQNNNSIAGSTYEYVKDQGNGKRFYRIKVLAKNGKIIYSEVVGVDTKCIIKKGF